MKKSIYVTDFDMKRFQWLSKNSGRFDEMYKKNLYQLEEELKSAVIVEPKDIPANVITMHTTFKTRDLETGEDNSYTLVFPFDADLEQNKISILTPIGVAVIGFSESDIVEWESPSGKRKIEIGEIIYQPERVGLFYS